MGKTDDFTSWPHIWLWMGWALFYPAPAAALLPTLVMPPGWARTVIGLILWVGLSVYGWGLLARWTER